jgi:hypothetical protein
MGDRTEFCEATPKEGCNEGWRIETCNSEVAVASFASGVLIRQQPSLHHSGCFGGARGAVRAGITTAAGGRAVLERLASRFYDFVRPRFQRLSCTVQKKNLYVRKVATFSVTDSVFADIYR